MGLHLIRLIAISMMIASCNPQADYALVGSAYIPAAHGQVDVEKLDAGQILITLTLDQLVAPSKVELGLTQYVVWFIPVGEYPQYQQALEYDAENRTGRASIPTSLREFELRVTAENSERPKQPSHLLMTSQKIREN